MDPAPAAILALAVLSFVPGFLVYRAIRPVGSALECVALAPTLGLAMVFLLGEATTITGTAFGPVPFCITTAGVGVVAALRWRRRTAPPARPLGARLAQPAVGLLAVGVVLAGLSWVFGLHGLADTPPATDSINHGLMAAQVANLESLDPAHVLTSDALDTSLPTETAFYPLAVHGEVALAHRIFGTGIGDGLLALTMLFSVLTLPIGLFVLARSSVPDNPLIPGLAALLGAAIGFVPVIPVFFGGLPTVIALAMVPAVLVVTARFVTGEGNRADLGLAVLGTTAILATHTTEIPLFALALGCVAGDAWVRRSQPRGRLLRRAFVFGGSSLLLILPVLPNLAGGTAERSGIDDKEPVSFVKATSELIEVVGFQNFDFIALAALAGIVICLRRRRHLELVALTALVLGLYYVAACLTGPVVALTTPWYRLPARIVFNLALVIPIFAGVALAELVPFLARFRPPQSRPRLLVPAVVPALILAVAGTAINAASFRKVFKTQVLVGQHDLAAFDFLKAEVRPGERVLNDLRSDGGLWMYAMADVAPLLGLEPARPGTSWRERMWLREHLSDIGTDPKVKELLEKYRVRFVYVAERSFDLNPHRLHAHELEQAPGICERLRSGDVRIFEVSPDSACA